jgi:hypothetical protein
LVEARERAAAHRGVVATPADGARDPAQSLGGPAAASVAAHVQLPIVGLSIAFVAVHQLAVPLGIWWTYLVGLAICVGWNAVLWMRRQRR